MQSQESQQSQENQESQDLSYMSGGGYEDDDGDAPVAALPTHAEILSHTSGLKRLAEPSAPAMQACLSAAQ